jgi:very-short-patch-repair endonuclease
MLRRMIELRRETVAMRPNGAKVGLTGLAERQWGVVSRSQLERRGVDGAMIARWAAEGRLRRVHRGVYAVGHRALSWHGRLAAALLYAGPGAMLSHTTAGWWLELCDPPPPIHVSVSGRRRSRRDVVVHCRRHLEPIIHRRLPVTSPAQTLLDMASIVGAKDLRRAVAEADYRRLLDLDAIEAVTGRGVPGSAALRAGIARYRPEVAQTRSVLEERFVALCEGEALPMPRINARVCGMTVDAHWPEQRIVVELDGHAGHATPGRVERDRRRDLRLRTAGHLVLRYTWRQVTREPVRVAADLRAALGAQNRLGAPDPRGASSPRWP